MRRIETNSSVKQNANATTEKLTKFNDIGSSFVMCVVLQMFKLCMHSTASLVDIYEYEAAQTRDRWHRLEYFQNMSSTNDQMSIANAAKWSARLIFNLYLHQNYFCLPRNIARGDSTFICRCRGMKMMWSEWKKVPYTWIMFYYGFSIRMKCEHSFPAGRNAMHSRRSNYNVCNSFHDRKTQWVTICIDIANKYN